MDTKTAAPIDMQRREYDLRTWLEAASKECHNAWEELERLREGMEGRRVPCTDTRP
jgi:hypothetical protein